MISPSKIPQKIAMTGIKYVIEETKIAEERLSNLSWLDIPPPYNPLILKEKCNKEHNKLLRNAHSSTPHIRKLLFQIRTLILAIEYMRNDYLPILFVLWGFVFTLFQVSIRKNPNANVWS